MKRGVRLGLVAALTLNASGMYALHPRGIALAWQLLLSRREFCYGLLLLSQVAIVVGCLAFLAEELTAYVRWKRSRPGPNDRRREVMWAVALHRFGRPARIAAALAETSREAWHERKRIYARGQRRWPLKKRELAGWLAQHWTRSVWAGVALVAGGEALTAGLSYRIPGYTLSPVLSLTAALVGMGVGNALMLLAWVAGDDDDDDGSRSRAQLPRPSGGHFRAKPARRKLRPGLRVQRANKQGVPQA